MMHAINQPALVRTNTEEFYFPSRLIYRINSKSTVLKKLGKLKCMYKHPSEDRWLIECSYEALDLNHWNEHYIKALRNNDPIIIAFIKFPTKKSMHIYLRAFNRVVPTLKLIDKYLPSTLAMGTHHDVCFKLITVEDKNRCPTPDEVFADESKIYYSDNMRRVDKLEDEMRLTGKDHSKQIHALFFKEMQTQRTSINDLERKRLEQFYVDGADSYSQTMKVQETMALARHSAGGKLNPLKFFEQVIKNSGKKITDLQEIIK